MTAGNDLVDAVKAGDVTRVQRAVAAGVAVEQLTDAWGWPLVHVAALCGKTAVARLLWQANPIKDRRRLRRALYLALESENEETVRYFLAQGAAGAPLFEQLYLRDVAALRALLQADRSQVDNRDEDSQTPLHVAANMNLREVAALLIQLGAGLEARNARGETPLFRSISNASDSVARLLLRHGADINTVTDYGQNALHCAASTHRPALVKLLQARGIDPAYDDLHVASALGRRERVQALLEADPGLLDKQDVLGATALYWSAAHRKLEVAAYLLSRGADPNIPEMQGRTPLLCATQRKDRPMIELLVRHGAGARPRV